MAFGLKFLAIANAVCDDIHTGVLFSLTTRSIVFWVFTIAGTIVNPGKRCSTEFSPVTNMLSLVILLLYFTRISCIENAATTKSLTVLTVVDLVLGVCIENLESFNVTSLESKLIIALFFLRKGLPKILKLFGITWKSSVNFTPLILNVSLTWLSTLVSKFATPWIMMFLFDNFSTHFDGIFARNWELRTFKLAPESNKNSVGMWWHFALIIVCHLPILRQCLQFSASTDTVSLTLVSIISTSLSTHSFMHSWYCNTLHFNVWSFDLLCLRLPRWLQALSEFCGLVSLKDAVSWMLTLLTQQLFWQFSLPQHLISLGGSILVLMSFLRLPLLLWVCDVASFWARGLPLFGETGDSPYCCWNVTRVRHAFAKWLHLPHLLQMRPQARHEWLPVCIAQTPTAGLTCWWPVWRPGSVVSVGVDVVGSRVLAVPCLLKSRSVITLSALLRPATALITTGVRWGCSVECGGLSCCARTFATAEKWHSAPQIAG